MILSDLERNFWTEVLGKIGKWESANGRFPRLASDGEFAACLGGYTPDDPFELAIRFGIPSEVIHAAVDETLRAAKANSEKNKPPHRYRDAAGTTTFRVESPSGNYTEVCPDPVVI